MQFMTTQREKPVKLHAIINTDQYVTDDVILCVDERMFLLEAVLNNLNLTDLDNL